MRWFILWVVVVLQAAPALAEGAFRTDAKRVCTLEQPTDFEERAKCVAAYEKILAWAEALGFTGTDHKLDLQLIDQKSAAREPHAIILSHCLENGKDFPDRWNMTEYCVGQQVLAYQKIYGVLQGPQWQQ
ncbi:MAG: hypothetical protein WAW96_12695 [Alphaproteobacteria bacterium]